MSQSQAIFTLAAIITLIVAVAGGLAEGDVGGAVVALVLGAGIIYALSSR